MVEILCGIYTGMNFGREIPPMYTSSIKKPRQLGQLYISIRIDGALSKKNFLKRMQKMTNQIRKEPKKNKESVKLPNDIEIINSKFNLKNGIKLNKQTYLDLKNLSKKFNIDLNLI